MNKSSLEKVDFTFAQKLSLTHGPINIHWDQLGIWYTITSYM